MSELLSQKVLQEIEDARRSLSERLGVNPGDFGPYIMADEDDIFPRLAGEILDQVMSGGADGILAKTIDHTILKPEALPGQVDELCSQARDYAFGAVCVNGSYVARARAALGMSGVELAAVVGFPLGQVSPEVKAHEARMAVNDGATEIDMVINVGLLKAGCLQEVLEDIRGVVQAASVPVKVIIETALLAPGEKIIACLLSLFAGAAFVKTSTGFSSGGATREDVALMRAVVGDHLGVKASGGIKTREDAYAMLSAGANRIGTSSGVQILGK